MTSPIILLYKLARALPPSRNKSRAFRIITDHIMPVRSKTIIEITMLAGHKMILDARSRTEAAGVWNGVYDEDDIEFFKLCIKSGDIVFDVGANVGFITIPLGCHLRALKSGKLISFEPVKSNYERLLANIRLNDLEDVVTAYNTALGNEEGAVELTLERNHPDQTGNAIMSKAVSRKDGFAFMECAICKLDTFAEKHNLQRADFIKLDIEGAEMLFLLGAASFLEKCRPIVYGEFNAELMPKHGYSFPDVHSFFINKKYRAFAFAGRLTPDELIAPITGKGNVFFVPEEKAHSLLKSMEEARNS